MRVFATIAVVIAIVALHLAVFFQVLLVCALAHIFLTVGPC